MEENKDLLMDEASKAHTDFPDFVTPPWPEWSDDELNRDTWQDTECMENGYFVDPWGLLLPPGLSALDWVRPSDLFESPVVFDPGTTKLDLISPNVHLCELSPLVRTILTEIFQLYELGLQNEFLCEGEYAVYAPNSENGWKPWAHVYGLNRAGVKGSTASVNPRGRYIVRVYYLGSWRKVAVDDRIPILKYGLFGLPVTESLELWPMLLTKALLKVAVLSGAFTTGPLESQGSLFSPISALTGWIHQTDLISSPVSSEELWNYLNEILPKYRSPNLPRKKKPSDFDYPTDSLFLLNRPVESALTSQAAIITSGKKEKSRKKQSPQSEASAKGTKKKGKGKKGSKGDQATSEDETDKESKKGKGKKQNKSEVNAEGDTGKKSKKNKSKDSDKSSKSKEGKKKKKKKELLESDVPAEVQPAEPPAPDTPKRCLLGEPKQDPGAPTTTAPCVQEPIPTLPEIIAGVQKFTGPLYHSAMANLGSRIGKDVPTAVAAIFGELPPPNDKGVPTNLSPPLQHSFQLAQVRDCPLSSAENSCLPPTPLWKSFRWKGWATKKGLVPRTDSNTRNLQIKSVLHKTPFPPLAQTTTKQAESLGEDPAAAAELGPVELPLRFRIPVGAVHHDLYKLISESQAAPLPPPDSARTEASAPGGKTKGKKNKDTSRESKKGKQKNKDPSLESKKGKGAKKDEESARKEGAGSSRKPKEDKSSANKDKNKSRSKPTSESGKKGTGKNKKFKSDTSGDESVLKESSAPSIVPEQACTDFWVDVDQVASNLLALNKYYRTRNAFGSNYIIRKTPEPQTKPVDPSENTHPGQPIRAEHRKSSGTVSIISQSEGPKTRRIEILAKEWQLNNLDDVDSGFYLFSDAWTNQELVFTLDVLQERDVKHFQRAGTAGGDVLGAAAEEDTGEEKTVPVTIVIKPWDWRLDCCLGGNVFAISTDTSRVLHLTVPPGRHLYRILMVEQLQPTRCFDSSPTKPHFALKIVSQTPITVGTREEVQSLMARETAQFLRQADLLARSVWGLFLSFGKSRLLLGKSLKQLRESYCPAYSQRNFVNKMLRNVHDCFENEFLGYAFEANEGKLNHWGLLTLRALFLNPRLGGELAPSCFVDSEALLKYRTDAVRDAEQIWKDLEARHDLCTWSCAARVIQRYFRGWQTRRLFKVRSPKYKHFERIEYELQKFALYFAQQLHPDFHFEPLSDPEQVEAAKQTPVPLFPKRVRWAVDILNYLVRENPWLLTIFPHGSSYIQKIRLRDVMGTLPSETWMDEEWIPFYRHFFACDELQTDSKLYQFDLHSYPNEDVFLCVVDNRNGEKLPMVNNRLFVGRLPTSLDGYTIICYKLIAPNTTYQPGREHGKDWKLRIISPDEESFDTRKLLYDCKKKENEFHPTPLLLSRFQGYYIPNDDFCICRYIVDVVDPVAFISVRFKTSDPDASFRLQVWEFPYECLYFEQSGTGSILVPSLRLLAPWAEGHAGDPWGASRGNRDGGAGEDGEEYFQGGYPEGAVHRYTIGIYVDRGSWPLTAPEWTFVEHQTKKFWKKMLIFRDKASEYDQSAEAERSRRALEEQKRLSTVPLVGAGVEQKDRGSQVRSKSASRSSSKSRRQSSMPLSRKQSLATKRRRKSSTKMPRSSSSLRESSKKNISEGNLPLSARDPGTTTDEGDSESHEEILAQLLESKFKELNNQPEPSPPVVVDEEDPEVISDEEDFECVKTISENLTVSEGGPDSQRIFDPYKPHWTLEILTDVSTNIKYKSSLREFQDTLIETKQEWERAEEGRYIRGRQERHNYLARNLIKLGDHSVLSCAQENKFLTRLHLDKSQLDGFVAPVCAPKSDSTQPPPLPTVPAETQTSPRPSASKIVAGKESTPGRKSKLSSKPGTKKSSHRGSSLKRSKSKVQQSAVSWHDGDHPRAGAGGRESKPIGRSRSRSPAVVVVKEKHESSEPQSQFDSSDLEESSQGVARPNGEGAVEMVPVVLETLHSKGIESVPDDDAKLLVPPRPPPTHVLMGPELQQCGVKDPAKLSSLDPGFFSMIRATGWSVDRAGQVRNTHHKLLAWHEQYRGMRREFAETLNEQRRAWNSFQGYFWDQVLNELEDNRYMLENSRVDYSNTYGLRAPGRSSQEFHVKSMEEIRAMLRRQPTQQSEMEGEASPNTRAQLLGRGLDGSLSALSELEFESGLGCR